MADLTDLATLKNLLLHEGISPRRQSGQHFLICSEVLETTLRALEGAPPRITELGSGVGTLTQALVAAHFTVKAIERDQRLAHLSQTIVQPPQQRHLTLIARDLRVVSWEWTTPYCLVGNIPYNLSGYIIRRLVQLQPSPERIILLVQKEVCDRITASPPHMNLLGLTAQLWGNVKALLHVPRSCFWPQPRVTSRLLLGVPHCYYSLQERERMLGVARQLFRTKRKQLGGTLARLLGISRSQAIFHLREHGIAATQRPQELTLEQWHVLVNGLYHLRVLKNVGGG